MLYFADTRWWVWHRGRREFIEFAGAKVTIENTGALIGDPEVFMLHNYDHEGLSERPNGLHTGSNGGYQAVNIAVLAGAKRILLLGYDMRFAGGRSHWHAGHPVKVDEGAYTKYARNFNTMLPVLKKRGVEVINCTPGSAITAFARGELEACLGRDSRAAMVSA